MHILSHFSRVLLWATPWTVAQQSSLWESPDKNTGVEPCPPSGDLPDPGIQPASPALPGGFFNDEPPGKPVCLDTNGEMKEAKTLK